MDTVNITLVRSDVENLLSSTKPSIKDCVGLEKMGLMKFTGNQHNPSWEWDFEKLKSDAPSTKELFNMYARIEYKEE